MAENNAKDLFTDVIKGAAQSTKKNGFMGLLSDNSITLKNLLFSGVVVLLELLLNSQVFDCPINNHFAYGTAFIAAPFFIVFITNLVILGEVSKLSDRCCVRRYWRWGECCGRQCTGIIKALFGPTVWLIASFVDSEYYVCLRVGQPIEKRNLTNETVIKALKQEFADAKRESHICAWSLLSLLVTVTAIVIIARNCCLKDNFLLEDAFSMERREAISALVTFSQRIRQKDVERGTPKDKAKTSEDEAKQSEGEAKPSEGEAKPSKSEAKPSEGEAKPSEGEAKPSESEAKPSESEAKPSEGEAKPSESEAKPSESEAKPSESEAKPSEGEAKPSKSEAKPSKSEATPSEGETNDNNNKTNNKGFFIRAGDFFKNLLYGDKKDGGKEEGRETTGRFIGNEEEIVLYPNGIPEQRGKERVEDLFTKWLEKDDRDYRKVRKDFETMYPRITSGKPWEPWTTRKEEEDNKKMNKCMFLCIAKDNVEIEERREDESKDKDERRNQEAVNKNSDDVNDKIDETMEDKSTEKDERRYQEEVNKKTDEDNEKKKETKKSEDRRKKEQQKEETKHKQG